MNHDKQIAIEAMQLLAEEPEIKQYFIEALPEEGMIKALFLAIRKRLEELKNQQK